MFCSFLSWFILHSEENPPGTVTKIRPINHQVRYVFVNTLPHWFVEVLVLIVFVLEGDIKYRSIHCQAEGNFLQEHSIINSKVAGFKGTVLTC